MDTEGQPKDSAVGLSIHSDHSCDISGRTPFKITIEIHRQGLGGDRRPLTLLKPGSLLDPSSAIAEGKIQVIDAKTGLLVRQSEQKEETATPIQLSMDFEDSFITLEPKPDRKHSAVDTVQYSFVLKNEKHEALLGNRLYVEAGHEYILQIAPGDLGVKWWNYGSKEELLAPKGSERPLTLSEPGRIYTRSIAKTRFFAVANLPRPPTVTISFSLSSSLVRLSGNPPVTLQVIIALDGPSPVTVRSTTTDRPPRTILHPGFQLSCFSVADTKTGEPVAISNPFIQNTPGQGYPKGQFLTLKPGEPIVQEHVLATPHKGPFQEARDVTPSMKGRSFSMRLNPVEVWWTEKSMDELFGDQQRVFKLPYVPPIKIASDNEIYFSVED